jgi:hypothetical protein
LRHGLLNPMTCWTFTPPLRGGNPLVERSPQGFTLGYFRLFPPGRTALNASLFPHLKLLLYRLRKNSIWKESWFYTEGGGGFNPRITPIKSMGAFRPGGVFSANYTEFLSFSAACIARSENNALGVEVPRALFYLRRCNPLMDFYLGRRLRAIESNMPLR